MIHTMRAAPEGQVVHPVSFPVFRAIGRMAFTAMRHAGGQGSGSTSARNKE
jgi:hypothetical protein